MFEKNDDLIFTSIDKIKYSARRGMLELDIILAPYLDNCYINESIESKKLFVEFLASEDSDLFEWLFKGGTAPDRYHDLISKIISAKKKYNQERLK